MAPVTNILLIGQFGPPLITFARSCVARNIRVHLLSFSKTRPALTRLSPLLTSTTYVHGDLKSESAKFIEAVQNRINTLEIDAVIAISDHYLITLQENAALLNPRCKILASDLPSLRILTSKAAQLQLASECGFEVLPTWTLQTLEDTRQIPESAFPLCLRPSEPGTVAPLFKAVVAQSQTRLNQLLAGLKSWNGEILAQPFLSLPNLVVHGARSESGEILALDPFLVDRKFEGLALTMGRTACPPEILTACANLANKAGIHGPFHFDLLYDQVKGRAFYLETNVRMGGTTAKVFRLGFDEPAFTLASFGISAPLRAPDSRRSAKRSSNKRSLAKYMVCLVSGRLTLLDYPADGFWKNCVRSAQDLFLTKDAVFDTRDLGTSLAYYSQRPLSEI